MERKTENAAKYKSHMNVSSYSNLRSFCERERERDPADMGSTVVKATHNVI